MTTRDPLSHSPTIPFAERAERQQQKRQPHDSIAPIVTINDPNSFLSPPSTKVRKADILLAIGATTRKGSLYDDRIAIASSPVVSEGPSSSDTDGAFGFSSEADETDAFSSLTSSPQPKPLRRSSEGNIAPRTATPMENDAKSMRTPGSPWKPKALTLVRGGKLGDDEEEEAGRRGREVGASTHAQGRTVSSSHAHAVMAAAAASYRFKASTPSPSSSANTAATSSPRISGANRDLPQDRLQGPTVPIVGREPKSPSRTPPPPRQGQESTGEGSVNGTNRRELLLVTRSGGPSSTGSSSSSLDIVPSPSLRYRPPPSPSILLSQPRASPIPVLPPSVAFDTSLRKASVGSSTDADTESGSGRSVGTRSAGSSSSSIGRYAALAMSPSRPTSKAGIASSASISSSPAMTSPRRLRTMTPPESTLSPPTPHSPSSNRKPRSPTSPRSARSARDSLEGIRTGAGADKGGGTTRSPSMPASLSRVLGMAGDLPPSPTSATAIGSSSAGVAVQHILPRSTSFSEARRRRKNAASVDVAGLAPAEGVRSPSTKSPRTPAPLTFRNHAVDTPRGAASGSGSETLGPSSAMRSADVPEAEHPSEAEAAAAETQQPTFNLTRSSVVGSPERNGFQKPDGSMKRSSSRLSVASFRTAVGVSPPSGEVSGEAETSNERESILEGCETTSGTKTISPSMSLAPAPPRGPPPNIPLPEPPRTAFYDFDAPEDDAETIAPASAADAQSDGALGVRGHVMSRTETAETPLGDGIAGEQGEDMEYWMENEDETLRASSAAAAALRGLDEAEGSGDPARADYEDSLGTGLRISMQGRVLPVDEASENGEHQAANERISVMSRTTATTSRSSAREAFEFDGGSVADGGDAMEDSTGAEREEEPLGPLAKQQALAQEALNAAPAAAKDDIAQREATPSPGPALAPEAPSRVSSLTRAARLDSAKTEGSELRIQTAYTRLDGITPDASPALSTPSTASWGNPQSPFASASLALPPSPSPSPTIAAAAKSAPPPRPKPVFRTSIFNAENRLQGTSDRLAVEVDPKTMALEGSSPAEPRPIFPTGPEIPERKKSSKRSSAASKTDQAGSVSTSKRRGSRSSSRLSSGSVGVLPSTSMLSSSPDAMPPDAHLAASRHQREMSGSSTRSGTGSDKAPKRPPRPPLSLLPPSPDQARFEPALHSPALSNWTSTPPTSARSELSSRWSSGSESDDGGKAKKGRARKGSSTSRKGSRASLAAQGRAAPPPALPIPSAYAPPASAPDSPQSAKKAFFATFASRKKTGSIPVPALTIGGLSPDYCPTSNGASWSSPPDLIDLPSPIGIPPFADRQSVDSPSADQYSRRSDTRTLPRDTSRESSASTTSRRTRSSSIALAERFSTMTSPFGTTTSTSTSPAPSLRNKASDSSLRVRHMGSDASLASTASKHASVLSARRLSTSKEEEDTTEADSQFSALMSPPVEAVSRPVSQLRQRSDEKVPAVSQQPPARPPRPLALPDLTPPKGLRAARSSIFPFRPKVDLTSTSPPSDVAPNTNTTAALSDVAGASGAAPPVPPKTVRKRSATISTLQRMTRLSEAARVGNMAQEPRIEAATDGSVAEVAQTPALQSGSFSSDGTVTSPHLELDAGEAPSELTRTPSDESSTGDSTIVAPVLVTSPEQTPRIGYAALHDDERHKSGDAAGGGLSVAPARRQATPSRLFTPAEEEGLEALGKTLVHGRTGTADSAEWPYASASTDSEASQSPTAETSGADRAGTSSTADTSVGDAADLLSIPRRVPRRAAKARKHRFARTTLGQRVRHTSLTEEGLQWIDARGHAAEAVDGDSGQQSHNASPFDASEYYGGDSDGSTDYYGSSDGEDKGGDRRGDSGGGGGKRGGDGRDGDGNDPRKGGNNEQSDDEDVSTDESEDDYEGDESKANAAAADESDEDSDDVPLAQRVQDPEELQRKLREREARRDRAHAARKAQAKAAAARAANGKASGRRPAAPAVLAAQASDNVRLSAGDLTQRLLKVQAKRDAAAQAQAARPPSSPRSAGHGLGLGFTGDSASVQTHESGGSVNTGVRDSSMSRARSLGGPSKSTHYRTAPSPHQVSPVARVVPLPSPGASPNLGLVPLPGGGMMPNHHFPYPATMGGMPHVSPMLMHGPMAAQMMATATSPIMGQMPAFDPSRAFVQQRADAGSVSNSSPSKSTVPLPSSAALQSRSRSQSMSRMRGADGRPTGLNGTAPPLPDLKLAQYAAQSSSTSNSSPMPSSGGHVPSSSSAHAHAERQADRLASAPPSSDPYSPSSNAPRSSFARSSAMDAPPPAEMVPPTSISSSQYIQYRVYVVTRQRYGTAEVAPTARARDLVLDILHKEHVPPSDGKGGGWVVFDVSAELGIERPLREYEVVSEVAASRANAQEDHFILKRTELAPYLSIRAVPPSSPVLAGWVYVQEAKGKWSKRWLELRDHSLFHAKSEKGKNEVHVCHLSSFDVYLADSAKVKAPKALAFAVRSQHSITMFEKPDQDYVHYFALTDPAAHRSWVRAIMNARTYVLRQERGALFRPPAGPQRATEETQQPTQSSVQPPASQPLLSMGAAASQGYPASDVPRARRRETESSGLDSASSHVHRGPNPFTSSGAGPQPQQHLINRAGPTASAIAVAQPFEKGSLLASQQQQQYSAADAQDFSTHERTRARMQDEARRNEMRERMARARIDGAPLIDTRR